MSGTNDQFDHQTLNAALSLITLKKNMNDKLFNLKYSNDQLFSSNYNQTNATIYNPNLIYSNSNHSTGYDTDYSSESSLLNQVDFNLSEQSHPINYSNSATNYDRLSDLQSTSNNNQMSKSNNKSNIKHTRKRKNTKNDTHLKKKANCLKNPTDCHDFRLNDRNNDFNNSNLMKSNYQKVNFQFNQQMNQQVLNPPLYQQVTHQSSCKPISYSDVDSDYSSEQISFTDSQFDLYYSESNLHLLNEQKCFDNKKYRIFVVRKGDELRVFKPVCIARQTQSLFCNIIGTYCLDSNSIDGKLPDDFIYPMSANKHEQNVFTIRKLIDENPVDELPYVDINEDTVKVKQFNLENDYFSSAGEEERDENVDLNAKVPVKRMKKVNAENDQTISSKSNIKSSVRPAHCPYCFQRFSATFNAKLHYHGRNSGNGFRISCKIACELSVKKTLEPIVCNENCMICLKNQAKN